MHVKDSDRKIHMFIVICVFLINAFILRLGYSIVLGDASSFGEYFVRLSLSLLSASIIFLVVRWKYRNALYSCSLPRGEMIARTQQPEEDKEEGADENGVESESQKKEKEEKKKRKEKRVHEVREQSWQVAMQDDGKETIECLQRSFFVCCTITLIFVVVYSFGYTITKPFRALKFSEETEEIIQEFK